MQIFLGILYCLFFSDRKVLICPERIPERCLLTITRGAADSIIGQVKSVKWTKEWPDNRQMMPDLELFVIEDGAIVDRLVVNHRSVYSVRRNEFANVSLAIDLSSIGWSDAILLPHGAKIHSGESFNTTVVRSKVRFSPNAYIGCEIGWKVFDLIVPTSLTLSADSISLRICLSRWRGKKSGFLYDLISSEHLRGSAISFRFANPLKMDDSAPIRNVFITPLTGKRMGNIMYSPFSPFPVRRQQKKVSNYCSSIPGRICGIAEMAPSPNRCGDPKNQEAKHWSGAFLFDGKVGLVLRGENLYQEIGTTPNIFRFVDLSGRPDDISGQLVRIDTCIAKSVGSQICSGNSCQYYVDGNKALERKCTDSTSKHVSFVVRWLN